MAEQGYIELKVILVCGGDIFHSHVNITFAAASLLMMVITDYSEILVDVFMNYIIVI